MYSTSTAASPIMGKLTLAETAAHFRKSPKTFSRYVRKLGIPHVALGQSMLFDLPVVEAYLQAATLPSVVVEFKPMTKKKSAGNRLAEMLGL